MPGRERDSAFSSFIATYKVIENDIAKLPFVAVDDLQAGQILLWNGILYSLFAVSDNGDFLVRGWGGLCESISPVGTAWWWTKEKLAAMPPVQVLDEKLASHIYALKGRLRKINKL